MAIAGRVFAHFATQLDSRQSSRGLAYVGSIFRLAALLHDVGHCAFSHSTEHVNVRGAPLFGTTRELLEHWRQAALLQSLMAAGRNVNVPVHHEEVGLALVRHLFAADSVKTLCKSELSAQPADVAQDVCAMMAGDIPFSRKWQHETDAVFEIVQKARVKGRFWGRVEKSRFAADLHQALHSLISGTLDVDRMDYLIRDSYHCGVPYGRCDVEVLIGNLSLGGVGGRLDLFLRRKAVDALDDLLWSRYQLFVQVLNHKANVAMNTLLSDAISDALADSILVLNRPPSIDEYLLFTDDHVMATITKACFHGQLEGRKYAKTLVDRRLPLHLGAEDDPNTERRRQLFKRAKARAAGVTVEKVFVGTAESTLVKGGAPTVLDWDRATRQFELRRFEEFSHFRHKGVPSKRRVLHYYVDRDDLKRVSR